MDCLSAIVYIYIYIFQATLVIYQRIQMKHVMLLLFANNLNTIMWHMRNDILSLLDKKPNQ
ncbi:hypothetical protein BD770DRAFT_398806 [Pilaira anomala]|nr:hypothetical protein BD770DRAFT_398806 [Pilaira anomala]